MSPADGGEAKADKITSALVRKGALRRVGKGLFLVVPLRAQLWALGEALGDQALLKGGTLLSKVDLGFKRMSEDADLVVPRAASSERRSNVLALNKVRSASTSHRWTSTQPSNDSSVSGSSTEPPRG